MGDRTKNDYHSKCDGHKNLLTLVKTTDNLKFGGFSSLQLNKNSDGLKDDTAFIFSLDKRENYYIKKEKNAVYFWHAGPTFGDTLRGQSEFTLTMDNEEYVDDTGSRCAYYYGKGRKHILAGKFEFKILDYEVFELEIIEE